MIVRRDGSDQLLITQPDHAALASRLMEAWRNDAWPSCDRRSAVQTAIAEHDNGWREPDAAPILDASGRILDFITAPDEIRRGVWPRGSSRLAATPYAAALVAQHALHVYQRYRERPDWQPFFEEMERIRARTLAGSPPPWQPHLFEDYFFVRMGDLLSLAFCNGWTEPQEERGYTLWLAGQRLVVTPDPFGGAEVPFVVSSRRLPDRRFGSPDEARETFAAAPRVEIAGVAAGS